MMDIGVATEFQLRMGLTPTSSLTLNIRQLCLDFGKQKDSCMDLWLRTNETEEAISALEMLAEMAQCLANDRYRWKWTIISMHNALQAFMVIALRHSDGLLTLKDKIAAQWLKWYREGGEFPRQKLDNFQNLYKKVQGDGMLRYVNSKRFEAGPQHDRAVKKLNELRNEFIHFVPKGWSLELTGLPEICLDCLEIIEFLGWESENVLWYEECQQERATLALKDARNLLAELKQEYEGAAPK